jgi:death on curing protein
MRENPVFLSVAQVKALHRTSLELHGGQDGIRDYNAFECAVLHPRNVWIYAQGDIFDIAAAYAFHLAEAQAFVDGNKRTGMAAALVFLDANGMTVPTATEDLHAIMIAISGRQKTKQDLAKLFRKLCCAGEG